MSIDAKLPKFIQSNHHISKYIDLQQLLDLKDCIYLCTLNSIYYGQKANNKYHGYGILKHPKTIAIYAGEWKNGLKHGKGYEKYSNGTEYQGLYKNGKSCGYGELTWPNGDTYQYNIIPIRGYWHNGQMNGYGEWQGQGTYCKGEWVDDVFEGKGISGSNSGDVYAGTFKNFLKHGLGDEKFSNGDKYQGEYEYGKLHGYGEYFWMDGSVYKGMFKNGQRNGNGTWQSSLSQTNGMDTYKGQYVDDLKNGYGEFKWEDGSIYKGNYLNNQQNGIGTMYFKGGKIQSGRWFNGKLVEKQNITTQCDQIVEVEEERLTSSYEQLKTSVNRPRKANRQFRMNTKPVNLSFNNYNKHAYLKNNDASQIIKTRLKTVQLHPLYRQRVNSVTEDQLKKMQTNWRKSDATNLQSRSSSLTMSPYKST